jgi:hypothetical protein
MKYASGEWGRESKKRGKEREEGNAWAYGKEWPWTTSSITRAYHVLPINALRAATKRREACEGEKEREGEERKAWAYGEGRPWTL